MTGKFIDVNKARSAEQLEQFQQIVDDGVCPFCPEHLEEYHQKPIIKRFEHWQLTENMIPYEGAFTHYLAIPLRHLVHIEELNVPEWLDLKNVIDFSTSAMKYGGVALRFGNFEHTAASVAHLHLHIFEPLKRTDDEPQLKFKIST